MPPHRRRPTPSPGQAPPIRRPKVAGLRNRPGQPTDPAEQPTEQPTDQPGTEQTTEQTAEQAVEQPAGEPDSAEQETGPGVLDGAVNEPPPVPERVRPGRGTDAAEPEPEDTDDVEAKDTDTDTDTDTEPRPVPAVGPKHRVAGARPADKAEGTRPAGKRRATGAARPDDLVAAETGAGSRLPDRSPRAGDGERPVRTRAQRQLSTAIVLAVAAVVLAGLAVFFRGKADDLTSGDSNTALTDPAATSQVKGQLTTAIRQTFSYNYTDLDSTEKAVRESLTGKALCEYNLLFGEVKRYAPEQKIVLDTTVRELAVVRIDGDRAEALVYIDQLSTRVDVNKTVAVGGQFAVRARKDGDDWKITEFDMFGQPLFNGKPAPKC